MNTHCLPGARVAGALLLLLVPLSRTADAGAGGGESLFNGKDLTGWVSVHDAKFEVNEGNLRLVTGMGWLRTEKQFRDFILECEWRALDPEYDSGIFFHAGLDGKPWPTNSYQVNLRYNSIGSLVKVFKTLLPSETPKAPLNKWVKLRLEVKGRKATLDMDGERAWEFDGLELDHGHLGIQAENKSFDFRNLRVWPLPEAATGKPK